MIVGGQYKVSGDICLLYFGGYVRKCVRLHIELLRKCQYGHVIDEGDIKYIQGIIDGVNKATDLSDANCDGQINESDINHVKSIISGEPIEITLIDNQGVTIKLETPINSIAATALGACRTAIHLESINKIVGMGSNPFNEPNNRIEFQAHPELREIPGIGTPSNPSQEIIIKLKPDVIFGTVGQINQESSCAISRNTGVPFVYAHPWPESFYEEGGAFENLEINGSNLGKDERQRAEELITYCDGKIKAIKCSL